MSELDSAMKMDLDVLEDAADRGLVPFPWDSTVRRLVIRLRATEEALGKDAE